MEVARYFEAAGAAQAGLGGPRASLEQNSFGRARRSKQSVAEAFLQRLQERGDVELSQQLLASILNHFLALPTRYALDVNIDSLDVLSHKRLLEEARADPTTVSFAVRPVEVLHAHRDAGDANNPQSPAFPEVRACMRGRWML
jgi:hypothetical protein